MIAHWFDFDSCITQNICKRVRPFNLEKGGPKLFDKSQEYLLRRKCQKKQRYKNNYKNHSLNSFNQHRGIKI